MSGNKLIIMLIICLLVRPACAADLESGSHTTVEVTATVLNSADVTDGVLSGMTPVQVDVTADTTIWSF